MTRKPLRALEGTSVLEKNKAIMQRGGETRRGILSRKEGSRHIKKKKKKQKTKTGIKPGILKDIASIL